LLPEVRRFFDGTIILAGAISDGRQVAAAQAMGADLAYLGTRFIATKESTVPDENRAMILDSTAADIVYTPAISGIPANFLRRSLVEAGLDPDNLPTKDKIDMGEELNPEKRAWKNIWSAGQGVGIIDDVPGAADLCRRLATEYRDAIAALNANRIGG
jgi:nitronate monooxygenase